MADTSPSGRASLSDEERDKAIQDAAQLLVNAGICTGPYAIYEAESAIRSAMRPEVPEKIQILEAVGIVERIEKALKESG